ncbi:hypothetical protein ACRE_038470 [Hapsidospora chrysogenum ATCC 11550]|uniref:DUF8004 domain-containing protein n=1 Tax=Hapsidospora chrysogenum (strain ATCC 11550 / CBS 779.69 / DSM 880 / IAM 14645 / JCM 23072 / IMI 49137) TaxID=857340 RepID=A0A086T7L0_HAPC1|nr:hypothetical protein ACRE_038470 [Hapsidospora chrysogenum ATCC 11550]
MASPWPGSGDRNLGTFVYAVCSKSGPVKRWDGAARTSSPWDGLRKDPELWLRNGNCHIHLYGKGQSRRGPSFKIPFKELLARKCFPLIERFLVTDGPAPRTLRQLEKWGTDPKQIVELYIPAPSLANKDQAFVYHVATRNFFAWVLRRSLVGEHLGHALVGLMYSMYEFRADVKDHVADLMDYMDEEGYVDVVNQPINAVAMVQLAETFQMKDLYIRALAHCVGMNDQVCTTSEYQQLSIETKKAIRRAKNDLDSRLDAATDMLTSFLDNELSESHLGIPSGARAHLERFRSFLLSYYTTRFGYYPPREFSPSICSVMRDELEALYKLLVDDTYSATEGMPAVASGGICTLQLVQVFDAKHGYEALDNPLPLLPQFDQKNPSRWMPWRARIDNLRPDQKLLAHTALIKASNWRESIFHNDLVKAYRKFEEDLVLGTSKADKQEKVSLVDARKVRWILVYATYQVLRSVTGIPSEVFDAGEAPYHVAISTKNLPSWSEAAEDMVDLMKRRTDLAVQSSPSIHWADSAGSSGGSEKIEIKPDIDYFALKRAESIAPVDNTGCSSALGRVSAASSTVPTRSNSVARSLSRNGTIRRSMRKFKPRPISPAQEATPLSRPLHHEIVVQGYGNGLNYVSIAAGTQTAEAAPWAERNNSAAVSNSGSSFQASSSPGSVDSGETLESTVVTPTTVTAPITPLSDAMLQPSEGKMARSQRRDTVSALFSLSRSNSTNGRNSILPSSRSGSITSGGASKTAAAATAGAATAGHNYSDVYEQLMEEQQQSFFGGDNTHTSAGDPRHRTSLQPHLVVEDDWASMQAFMDGRGAGGECDAKHGWEQYADLGGLTEVR